MKFYKQQGKLLTKAIFNAIILLYLVCIENNSPHNLNYVVRPLTKLRSAVKFFVKNLFKLREIWYNVGIENSVIMGCRNAFGRNKSTNKNGVCMYRGFGTERPYFKKDR